jgi:hypothetical protein
MEEMFFCIGNGGILGKLMVHRVEIRIPVAAQSRPAYKKWLAHFKKCEPLWAEQPRLVRGTLRIPLLVYPYLLGYAHTDWLSTWDIHALEKVGKKQLRYLFSSSEAPAEINRQAWHAWMNLNKIRTGEFLETASLSTPA